MVQDLKDAETNLVVVFNGINLLSYIKINDKLFLTLRKQGPVSSDNYLFKDISCLKFRIHKNDF